MSARTLAFDKIIQSSFLVKEVQDFSATLRNPSTREIVEESLFAHLKNWGKCHPQAYPKQKEEQKNLMQSTRNP